MSKEKEELREEVLEEVRRILTERGVPDEDVEKVIEKERDFSTQGHGTAGLFAITEVSNMVRDANRDYKQLDPTEVAKITIDDFIKHQEEYDLEDVDLSF